MMSPRQNHRARIAYVKNQRHTKLVKISNIRGRRRKMLLRDLAASRKRLNAVEENKVFRKYADRHENSFGAQAANKCVRNVSARGLRYGVKQYARCPDNAHSAFLMIYWPPA